MREVIWREASTLDLFYLATGNNGVSAEVIHALEQKFGFELKKKRPWGLVVQSKGEFDLVFSRTTKTPPKVSATNISHPKHMSDCYLDQDGFVECLKRFLVPVRIWQQFPSARTLSASRVICDCRQATCTQIDKRLISQINAAAKEKPFLLISDSIGNKK